MQSFEVRYVRFFRWVLVVMLVLLTAPAAVAAEFKVVAKRADCSISVGDRDADGNDLIVAHCRWALPLARVVAAFENYAQHDDYLWSVVESTILADGRVLQVHQANGIADRQITLDFTNQHFPDGGFKSSWTRSAVQEPLAKGRVDAPLDDGSWEVHPGKDGVCDVTYSLRYDPGGRVPTWIVRAFQKGGTGDILEQMREAASR
ncbi:MAG TPA: hypothetical protein DIU15_11830 [Deltaproteobacteria bacterium]|nr:hypothetical protein [Deltaproteobacteria bacterium]HCP46728.1 hypothetical protein [Deltaproteobacteria bacterium]|tara:strand:- start:244 stop:855 length:612 start_codon:yes stop_codon:yes gene_type:complete